jgi:hypothetical protein
LADLEREEEVLVKTVQHFLLQLVDKSRIRTWTMILNVLYRILKIKEYYSVCFLPENTNP